MGTFVILVILFDGIANFSCCFLGVPKAAVCAECEMEGKDSQILDLDPELPLKLQLDELYCNNPRSRHILLLAFEDADQNKKEPDSNHVVLKIEQAFEAEYSK